MYLNTDIRRANWRFANIELRNCYQLGRGGTEGRGGVGSGVGWLRRLGGGAPVPLRLHRVCRFLAVHFSQGRHLAVCCWRSIARFLSITASTLLCPGNATPRIVSSWTSAWGLLIRTCGSIAARCNRHLAIFAMFQAGCTLDCSCCSRPPCLAIVANMLKTYKKLVAAANDEIWQLPQPYMLL